MATRAERFRSTQERSGPKRDPKPKAPTRRVGKDAQRELGAEVAAEAAPHNNRARAKNATVYEYEATRGARPSRKSSRASAGHVKHGAELKRKVENRLNSAPGRAARKS